MGVQAQTQTEKGDAASSFMGTQRYAGPPAGVTACGAGPVAGLPSAGGNVATLQQKKQDGNGVLPLQRGCNFVSAHLLDGGEYDGDDAFITHYEPIVAAATESKAAVGMT